MTSFIDMPVHRARALRRAAAACGWAAATLVALPVLQGCGASPPVRYHALVAIAPSGPVLAYDGPVVQVAAVRLPAELDRDELLRESTPGRFEVSDADHWAAPLSRLARQTLAEDLAARLPAGRTAFPGSAWPPAGARLSVDVLSFTLRDGVASMTLSWSLHAGNATGPGAGAQWRLQAPATDQADALGALLAQLADRLALALPR